MGEKTAIVVIMDKSGSMWSIAEDAVGGYNSFLAAQKKVPGEATMTLVLFDSEVDIPVLNEDLQKVPPLKNDEYIPSGSTALLDAIGNTVVKLKAEIEQMDEAERPTKVIVAILTDGAENSSREYSLSAITSLIETHKALEWEFVYLGANQDAIRVASFLSIDASKAVNFAATGKGIRDTYEGMSTTVTAYRNSGNTVDIKI